MKNNFKYQSTYLEKNSYRVLQPSLLFTIHNSIIQLVFPNLAANAKYIQVDIYLLLMKAGQILNAMHYLR